MMEEKERYKLLCQSSVPTSFHPEGVIVASDLSQEWLLPWWWDHYKNFNNFPVTFVDLGLSPKMKTWCQKRGNHVKLPISGTFVTEKKNLPLEFVSLVEKKQGTKLWDSRRLWFLKPLSCLQSPYKSSLWIDLDCEIRGSLKKLFTFCNHPSGVSLAQRPPMNGSPYFNSGVIAFQKETKLIRDWATESLSGHLHYVGDQDLLSDIINRQKISVGNIPPIYNWSRFKNKNPEAIIFHWHGTHGKNAISFQIQKKKLPI